MGMKYREKCYNLQKRKKNLNKLLKISRIHLKLRAKNAMELLVASASQIPGEIFLEKNVSHL